MNIIDFNVDLGQKVGSFAKPLWGLVEVGKAGWGVLRSVGTLVGGWFQVGAYNSYSHAAEQNAQATDGIQTTQTRRTMIALGQDPANSPEGHAAAEKGASAAGGYTGFWGWLFGGSGGSSEPERAPLRTFVPVNVASAGGNSGAYTPMTQQTAQVNVDPAAQQTAQAQAQAQEAVDPATRQMASLSPEQEAMARDARMLGTKAWADKYGSQERPRA